MESLLPNISDWFKDKEIWFRTFAKHDSRVEGWFKGEMLVCLEHLKDQGCIEGFDREFTIGKKGWGEKGQLKIDLRVRNNGQNHLCELKAMCISRASGTSRDLNFYFRPNQDVGLVKDFKKLASLQTQDALWILSFVYPSPSTEDWNRALGKWQEVITPWACMTDPSSYPNWCFLGCWQLHKNPS